jgi:1-acyl-sn-glycerol-3-phosphate acyltransferase
MLARARRAVAEDRPIAIFPEGTRTAVGARLPYHPGVAALYVQLGVPLVPVAVNSGVFWGRRSFLKFPGRIVLEILPAIAPGQPRRKVMAELETRIEAATARLVAAADRTGPA